MTETIFGEHLIDTYLSVYMINDHTATGTPSGRCFGFTFGELTLSVFILQWMVCIHVHMTVC